MNTQQLAEQLKGYNSIAIIVGGEPSVDSLGSALALSLGLSSLGKSTQVITKNPIRAEHSRLVGCDKVEQTVSASKNFVITLPNAVDVIEKVSCYAEGQKLNIVLQPYADIKDFNPADIQYAKVGGSFEAILLVDMGNQQEAQMILGEQVNLLSSLPVISLGRVGDQRSPMAVIDPMQSATAQIVLRLLSDLRVQLAADIANNLLQSIYSATDDFHSPAMTPKVFEDAAQLLKFVHKETGPQRSPIAPPVTADQVGAFDTFGPQPMAGRMPAPLPPLPRPNAPMPPRMPNPGAQGANRPLPPLPPLPSNFPAPAPTAFPQSYGSDEWEINPDLEFDRAPDQSMFMESMRGQMSRPKPQNNPVKAPQVGRETASLKTTPPQPQRQNQNQNRPQQNNPGGQHQGNRNQNQQNQNQKQKDSKQSQAQEDDWLSPKIYKTEDLL